MRKLVALCIWLTHMHMRDKQDDHESFWIKKKKIAIIQIRFTHLSTNVNSFSLLSTWCTSWFCRWNPARRNKFAIVPGTASEMPPEMDRLPCKDMLAEFFSTLPSRFSLCFHARCSNSWTRLYLFPGLRLPFLK